MSSNTEASNERPGQSDRFGWVANDQSVIPDDRRTAGKSNGGRKNDGSEDEAHKLASGRGVT